MYKDAVSAAILCSVQHAVYLSQCMDGYHGSYDSYDFSPGTQRFTGERLEVLTATRCLQHQLAAWERWLQLGQGRCFQAHNFCNFSYNAMDSSDSFTCYLKWHKQFYRYRNICEC